MALSARAGEHAGHAVQVSVPPAVSASGQQSGAAVAEIHGLDSTVGVQMSQQLSALGAGAANAAKSYGTHEAQSATQISDVLGWVSDVGSAGRKPC